jgi:DNA-binding CsgD family transcriptional regulator
MKVSHFDQITCSPKITMVSGVNHMRVFWEQTGVLLPIYRLAGQGMSDYDIAAKLSITEVKVQSCMAWLLHFLQMSHRNQLVAYDHPARHQSSCKLS